MVSAELVSRLAYRFSPPEWAFFEQVPSYAAGTKRTADALAMNLWPSRGLEVHGFEVKVSRSDWLREMKKPEKADVIASYCDRFWLVVAEAKIVQPGEIPAPWGILGPRGDGLVIVKEAEKLAAQPIDRDFVAAILRKATTGVVPASEVEARVQRAREEIEQQHQEREKRDDERIRELSDTIVEFQKRSGLRLDSWRVGDMGDAVRALLQGDAEHMVKDMENVRGHAARMLAEMDEQIAAVQAGIEKARAASAPEHVSKPIARVMAQLGRKVGEG